MAPLLKQNVLYVGKQKGGIKIHKPIVHSHSHNFIRSGRHGRQRHGEEREGEGEKKLILGQTS